LKEPEPSAASNTSKPLSIQHHAFCFGGLFGKQRIGGRSVEVFCMETLMVRVSINADFSARLSYIVITDANLFDSAHVK
jgi:hypothetical protein